MSFTHQPTSVDGDGATRIKQATKQAISQKGRGPDQSDGNGTTTSDSNNVNQRPEFVYAHADISPLLSRVRAERPNPSPDHIRASGGGGGGGSCFFRRIPQFELGRTIGDRPRHGGSRFGMRRFTAAVDRSPGCGGGGRYQSRATRVERIGCVGERREGEASYSLEL